MLDLPGEEVRHMCWTRNDIRVKTQKMLKGVIQSLRRISKIAKATVPEGSVQANRQKRGLATTRKKSDSEEDR